MSNKPRILLVMLEFSSWERGRAWGYTGNFAIEAGLAANGAECLVLPAFAETPSSSRESWLFHARRFLEKEKFDQVWLWLVHAEYDPSFFDWLDQLAPVRVGWLGESLDYHPEEYAQFPHLVERRPVVEAQVSRMTHILAVDEADAAYINRTGLSKAIWLPMAVPEKFMAEPLSPSSDQAAVFYGSVYGERGTWLQAFTKSGLIHSPSPPENATTLPACFNKLNNTARQFLASGREITPRHLHDYVAALRSVREGCFSSWMHDLEKRLAMVNLPSFGKVYTSRVAEAMAAGCPVISWEIPDRPRNRSLFSAGEEILLFRKDQPALLGEYVQRLRNDREFGRGIAAAARRKIWRGHTVEKRMRQVLDWIDSGAEPDYLIEDSSADFEQAVARFFETCSSDSHGKEPSSAKDDYYQNLFRLDPEWSSPNPNQDESARWYLVGSYLNDVKKAQHRNTLPRILDLGCGRGWLTNLLQQFGRTEGVDPVSEVIQVARHHFPGIPFYAGTAETVLEQSGFDPYDIVVSSEVIEHVPRNLQRTYVANIRALLGRKGFAVITTPRAEVFERWMNATNWHQQPVEEWLGEDELASLFASEGFRLVGRDRIYVMLPHCEYILNPTADQLASKNIIALYQTALFRIEQEEDPVSQEAGKPEVANGISTRFPRSVHFLLNDKCNARCVFCGGDYYRSRTGHKITLEKFEIMAANLHLERFATVVLAGAGDPLIHSDFIPIIEFISQRYPRVNIAVTSNGINLTREISRALIENRVHMLNISLNAGTRDTYRRLMQVDEFDKVCSNIEAFSALCWEQKRGPNLQISCPILKSNLDELPAIVEFGHRVNARLVNVFYCRFYPHQLRELNLDDQSSRLDENESLFFDQERSDRVVSEARKLAESYGMVLHHEPFFSESATPRHCHWTDEELMVGFNGEVFPCGGGELHFKKKLERGAYDFGNALQQTIEEFWNNDSYRAIRLSSRCNGRGTMPECGECANMTPHNERRGHILEWSDFSEVEAPHPLVSVIVPTFNRPDMLREAIQSILAQTLQDFEIVVVNDAGEDVTPVVRGFNSDKIISISHDVNKGLAATRNTGIRAARGKYIAYLDDDDLFYPDHLETLATFLENNSFKVAYTDANEALQRKVDGEWVVVEKSRTYSIDFDAEALLVNNFTPVLCVMHQKECLDTAGLFDESLRRHEDWEMWIRMSRHYPFAHIREITCEFSTRDDGLGMREGALPSFLFTYRAVCHKHRALADGNKRVQTAQQREVYSLLNRSYQFMIRKLMAGADAASLATAGATECQIQSAVFLHKALTEADPGEKRRYLEEAIAADPENVVAREALPGCATNSENSDATHASTAHRAAASIVIVTYNSISTLAACIESVARSLSRDDEVVLVDNASRDETVSLLEQMTQGNPAFRIIRNETNAGFARATNQGIMASKNPLVVLLNPDTVVPKEWLDGLSRHLSDNVAAVGPVSNYVAGLQKMEFYQKGPLPAEVTIDDVAGLFQQWNDGKGVDTSLLIGFCMMVRREALERIGYLDDALFLGNDDLDISWRFRSVGYRLVVATDVFVFHTGQVSFSSEPNETTRLLVQESTDHLYQKLVQHYAPEPVPSPQKLWGIDWFKPSDRALAAGSITLQGSVLKDPLTSIIILTWNQLPFTRACLESIARNTPEAYQLIIVDNGSSDGSVPWLREQAASDSRIALIENSSNLGFAAGCNQGIRASKGEFILLLNNDTVVTDGWLSGMRELLERYPDTGIVGPMTNSASGVQVVPDSGSFSLDALAAFATAFRERNRYRIIPQRRIVGFCMVFRRALVEKVGLLDESFGSGNFEDDDYCLRAELAGYRNLIAGDVFVYHAGGATFSGNRIDYSRAMQNNFQLFKKKWAISSLDEATLRRWLVLRAIEEAKRLSLQGLIDDAAGVLIQKGIKADPSCKAPYTALVEMLIASGRFDEALQVLPEMPADTERTIVDEYEAICYAGLGDDAASSRAAERTPDTAGNRTRILVVLGTLAARRNNMDEAESLFRRAIDKDPSSAEGWISLGMLLWGKGEQETAWQAIRRAATVGPLHKDSIKIYRDMATRMDKLEDAASLIGEACCTYPDSRELSLMHALVLTDSHRTSEALSKLESFITKFGPDDAALQVAMGLRESAGIYRQTPPDDRESITLCMIVKNEERDLARCIASVKPVVHEIIVVDTGSEDKTIDIATAFGARVYDFPWNGNFSDARNFAIDKAKGSWILIMDADEVLGMRDHEPIRKAVRSSTGRNEAWSVVTRNYTDKVHAEGWTANDGTYQAEEASDGWHPSWKVRLFPNHAYVRFRGEVHELVEPSLREAGYEIRQAPFVVHHYGGLEKYQGDASEKQKRYFEIGMKKLANKPDDIAALTELAVLAGELKQYEDALSLWKRVLALDPGSVEALFNSSYALIGLKRYPEALVSARKALDLSPSHKEAAFNYATCELYAGDPARAISLVAPISASHPDYPPLYAVLTALYLATGESESAEKTLDELRQRNYAIADYLAGRAETLDTMGRTEAAARLRFRASDLGMTPVRP